MCLTTSERGHKREREREREVLTPKVLGLAEEPGRHVHIHHGILMDGTLILASRWRRRGGMEVS